MASTSPVNFDCSPSAGTKRPAPAPLELADHSANSLKMTVQEIDRALVVGDFDRREAATRAALAMSSEEQACLAEQPGLLTQLLDCSFLSPGRIQRSYSDLFQQLVRAWHHCRAGVMKDGVRVQGTANIVLDDSQIVNDLLNLMINASYLTWPWRVLQDAIRFHDKCRGQCKYTAAQLLGRVPGILERLLTVMDCYHDMSAPALYNPDLVRKWASGLLAAGVARAAAQANDVSDSCISRALRLLREPTDTNDGVVDLFLNRAAPLSERLEGEARAVIGFRKAMQALRTVGDRTKAIRELEEHLDECKAK